MYPGHNTRGGTSIHGSGLGPRMPMANQMVPPGIRAFNQNPAPNPNYLYNQHGAMNMMMQMGSNYKWQMMAQYGAPMMPQMYNNQNQQMPMYNPGLTQTSNQVSQPSPPVTISNRNSMKLPTIVCPSEEPKRPTQQQQQPQKTSGPRRSSKSSPAYGQNQGRQNAPAQQPPSCNSSKSSDSCYVPLQQALSMIEADKQKHRSCPSDSSLQSNPGVGVVRSLVVPVTMHVSKAAEHNYSSSSLPTTASFNPIISNITSLSNMPLKVVDVRSVAEETGNDAQETPAGSRVNTEGVVCVSENTIKIVSPTASLKQTTTKAPTFVVKSPPVASAASDTSKTKTNSQNSPRKIQPKQSDPPQFVKVIFSKSSEGPTSNLQTSPIKSVVLNKSRLSSPIKSVVLKSPLSSPSKSSKSPASNCSSPVKSIVCRSPAASASSISKFSILVNGSPLLVSPVKVSPVKGVGVSNASSSLPSPVSSNTAACSETASALVATQSLSSTVTQSVTTSVTQSVSCTVTDSATVSSPVASPISNDSDGEEEQVQRNSAGRASSENVGGASTCSSASDSDSEEHLGKVAPSSGGSGAGPERPKSPKRRLKRLRKQSGRLADYYHPDDVLFDWKNTMLVDQSDSEQNISQHSPSKSKNSLKVSPAHNKSSSPRHRKKSGKSPKYSISPSFSGHLEQDDVMNYFRYTKSYKYQHQSEMILTSIAQVDIPLFLARIQGHGRKTYRRLTAQMPDVFLELSQDFIFLEEESRYSCLKCYFVSPRIEKALEHELAHHGPMICKLCNKAFIKQCDEYRHMEAHKYGRITCKSPRFLPPHLRVEDDPYVPQVVPLDLVKSMKREFESERLRSEESVKENHNTINIINPPIDSSRVLDISPMESNGSNGSLATHMNPMHRAPGAISERSRSSESTSSSSLSQGIGNGTGNKGSLRGFRTEIHDSSTVIVISPCSSPRIKSEPVDDYWTSYRNGFSANTNGYLNNVQTVSPVNTPAVSTWSTNIAPPLPSLTTWAQEMSPSSRMRPTLPPSIPPPPPLMSSTSVQSGNQLHNAVVLPTAPQVIPVSIGIPNLLQEPVVTTAPSPISAWTESRNQHQNLPANDTTASSIPAASSISYPLPVVRHSSSETQVVERAPIMSKILSSSISINVQSQPITTSNTLSSCSTQVSSCASVTPLPAALQASNLQTERSIAQIASSTGSTKAESSTSGTYTPSVPITMGSPSYGGFIPILPKPPILNVPSFVNGTSSTKTCQVMQAPLTTPHLLESLSLPSLPPRPRTNIPTEKMYLACQICSYVGKSAQALERHYNAHSKNQVCRFCKKAYELVSKLRTHEKQHLAAGDILPEDGAQFSQDSVSVTTCNDTSGTDLPSPLSNSESSSGSNVLEIQPEVAHCESASSDNQPAMANTQSSTDPSSALDGQGASPSNELNLKNLPFRIDHFMNSVLTETSLFQCDVDDNNEITISFAPFVIGETDLDLIKLCPPVATIGDISEIMEGVRKATDSVDVKVLEVIMPKTKKRKKDSSEEGSKKKKKKKLMGYLKLEKKKKSKRKRRSGSNLDDEDEVAVDSSQHNDGTSVGAGDETSDIQLPGNYVADPVHYDTMTDDSITSPHRALLSPKSTQSTLLSPNKTTPNGKISPKKDNSTSNVTPAETQEGSVPGKYKCTTCSFTTDVKMKLKGHEKAHEMNLHMCEFCYKTFFKMADLVRHVDSTHKQNQEPKSDEERDGLSFSCDCCDYQTDLYARFKMHQNLHKTGQNICQWCGKALFNVEHLVRHWFTHNKKDNLNRYTCNLCQYKVSEKQQMTSHMTSHYKEKPVGLPSKPSLTKGKKSKVKDSSACPECGAVFTLPSLLSSHRRKVHNVVSLSTYKCDACDVSYMSQRKLQRHVMEKHTSAGNNPPVTVQQTHTCNVCERKFASAAYLARHAVVHSTEKHFKCKSCSKRFTYHHHMNMHQRKCFKPKNAVKKATPVTKGGGGGDIKLGDVLKINTSNKLNQLASNVSQKSPKVGADAPVPDHVSIADDDDDIIFLDFEIIPET